MTTRKFFSSPWRTVGFVVLLVITFLWLIPFLQAILTSMRTNTDIMTRGFFSLPSEISFESFAEAWQQRQAMQAIRPIAKKRLDIDELEHYPDLLQALSEAYQAGKDAGAAGSS